MKSDARRLSQTLAATLVMPLLLHGAATVNLTNLARNPTNSPVENGVPVTITVDAITNAEATIVSVNLIFRTLAAGAETNLWTTNAMTWVSGNTYSGQITPLVEGGAEYGVVCHFTGDGAVSPATTAIGSYTVASVPGERRYTDFHLGGVAGWVRDGGTTSSNWYCTVTGSSDRWYGTGVRVDFLAGVVYPSGGASPYMYLRSIQGAWFETPPLDDAGVGTIYFTSRLRQEWQSAVVAVQITTNASPVEADWETVREMDYPYGSTATAHAAPVVVNRRDVRRVRFVRMDTNPYDLNPGKLDGAVLFDNIVISRPPADVTIEERLRNPGYPARDQDVKMRCHVSDSNPNALAINHNVKVWYQWLPNAVDIPSPAGFSSTNMLPVGGGVYEGVIPMHENGYMHYYYSCDYDGYYYSRDPDGAGTNALYNENNSPNYWAASNNYTSLPDTYSRYEIRRYRSVYGEMWVEATPEEATVPMELVGDENWQGLVLVTGITNLTWYYRGLYRYDEDAPTYSSETNYWGDNNQDFPFPPVSGDAEVSATNGVHVELEYNGFLMTRFNTASRYYLTKRAVYQNFNEWQASPDYFEESVGLYSAETFPLDFGSWPGDAYDSSWSVFENFENDSATADFLHIPTVTANYWVMDQAKVIADRQTSRSSTNMALLLDKAAIGRIGNTGTTITKGVEKFTYRARASITDQHFALYTAGFGWTLPLNVGTRFKANEMSPGSAYFSVLVGYQPAYVGSSCYEVRLVQTNETEVGETDRALQIQVWRWNADMTTPNLVGSSVVYDGNLVSEGDRTLFVGVTNNTGSARTEIRVSESIGLKTPTVIYDYSAERLTTGGTIGFLTHDLVPSVSSNGVSGGGSLAVTDFSAPANWYWGGKRDDAPTLDRWTEESGGGKRRTRLVPTQHLALYTAPRTPGQTMPDPEAFVVRNTNITVSSLSYVNFTEQFHLWNESFVELRYMDGDVNVVVDDPRLYPWRANTRDIDNSQDAQTDDGVRYYDWPNHDSQSEWLFDKRGWAVLEGWVGTSPGSTGNEAQFDRSRANPVLDQALVTPVLSNGIGSIAFSYRVTGGRAIYAVEHTQEGIQSEWITVAVYTNDNGQNGSRFVPVREDYAGRIRISVQPESDSNSVLKVDNLFARNYPPRDETTWQGYNVLVTSLQTNRSFDGQTCYLNNDPTNGAAPNESFYDHRPYVQTPMVGTGIGEIGFWYRVWEPGLEGVVSLYMAASADLPDDQWTLVTNLTVSSANFAYFSIPEAYYTDYKVLRICGTTNDSDRICIDNVLVTEPVRAGYEILAVTLTPEQPQEYQPTQVAVQIGRFIMNPQNIEVFLSYHTGTNLWGATNWWTETSTADSVLIELERDGDSNLYRTPTNSPIPALPVDTCVQYIAWGTYSNLVGRPIFQDTNSFVNPSWYWPVDLNQQYAASGWSPYYYVYSCRPDAVWINEFNYYSTSTDETRGEYVELLGPAQTLLEGWRIELINRSTFSVYDQC
ncbi:MAG: hypothetical protein PHR35_08195, partial [Kiritimatiellae bacterium]|nr:hypothetical protein [Kiritimatiellia bacterium]